jgi:hypothetical protein
MREFYMRDTRQFMSAFPVLIPLLAGIQFLDFPRIPARAGMTNPDSSGVFLKNYEEVPLRCTESKSPSKSFKETP